MIRPWKERSSERRGEYRVFSVHEVRREDPRTGAAHPFYVLDCPDWTNVVALTPAREVVLIRQFRHGTKEVTLEIPGGSVDRGETPAAAAVRELLEETGYGGAPPELLGVAHPNPAIQGNRCHMFLVRDARPLGPARPEGLEDIEVHLRPLAEIPALLRSGAIAHSLVVCAFGYLFLREEFRAGT